MEKCVDAITTVSPYFKELVSVVWAIPKEMLKCFTLATCTQDDDNQSIHLLKVKYQPFHITYTYHLDLYNTDVITPTSRGTTEDNREENMHYPIAIFGRIHCEFQIFIFARIFATV
ncbi:hypothetical protein GQR58_004001 [Nymphon striatum]|nr:hypothetical protein GQR58_004001 [Nymphon striatum]